MFGICFNINIFERVKFFLFETYGKCIPSIIELRAGVFVILDTMCCCQSKSRTNQHCATWVDVFMAFICSKASHPRCYIKDVHACHLNSIFGNVDIMDMYSIWPRTPLTWFSWSLLTPHWIAESFESNSLRSSVFVVISSSSFGFSWKYFSDNVTAMWDVAKTCFSVPFILSWMLSLHVSSPMDPWIWRSSFVSGKFDGDRQRSGPYNDA